MFASNLSFFFVLCIDSLSFPVFSLSFFHSRQDYIANHGFSFWKMFRNVQEAISPPCPLPLPSMMNGSNSLAPLRTAGTTKNSSIRMTTHTLMLPGATSRKWCGATRRIWAALWGGVPITSTFPLACIAVSLFFLSCSTHPPSFFLRIAYPMP